LAETKSITDIRDEIAASFETYATELAQAGPHWDRKPPSGDGEDAWCARQVAEHIAGAGLFFGNGIATAIGADAPALERISLDSVDQAVSKTSETHAALMRVLDNVTDSHLPTEVDHPRLGKQTVGSILGIVNHHLNDHANQLRTLRES
jgi:hypothetical protein